MSLRDFWINVARGAKWVNARSIADVPKVDAAKIESRLRETDSWLTPKSVAGYNEADFEFLPEQQRQELTRLVEEFRKIASEVSVKKPATSAQIEQALPLFRDIILMLGFDHYNSPEAFQIGKKIENAIHDDLPSVVAELRFKTALDHTGDPGVWIWAILSEETDEAFQEYAQPIRKLLESASRAVTPDRWPYVNFRSVLEQADIEEMRIQ